MAVVQVVGQGVQDPRLQPEGSSRGEPQVHGQFVRRGKGDEQGFLHQEVGLARRAFRARSPYRRYRGVAMDRGRLWAERKSSRRRA